MRIPFIDARLIILLFAQCGISVGDICREDITLFVVYPLLSRWIDIYYRRLMMGKLGVILLVMMMMMMMMIGIVTSVLFLGIAGFIADPGLVAFAVPG